MATRAELPEDPYALPVVRGHDRKLEPRVNPESKRDLLLWRRRMERSRRPLCVSLWSGAGGLDLGLEQAGYDVVVAADHDLRACQTHGHNSNALVFCRDLDDPAETRAWLRGLELSEVALVAGGFPCQPYSRAGRSIIRHLVESERRPEIDTRAFAWLSFVAAVKELRPRHALAENVPDLARFNDGRQLRDIVVALEDIGYSVDCRVVLARQYGVPQYRERLFIQAAREGDVVRWPEPVTDADDALESAIGDLPVVPPGHQEDPVPYIPRRDPPDWARQRPDGAGSDLLYDHVVRDVREDDLLAFQQLQPGGTYLDVPEELRRYDDENFTDKYKRLEWEAPSRTITAHIARDGYWYIHPEQHRTLSIREAARVQTFPDWFLFSGFPSNRLTQIGNAVPPMLARAIGESILSDEAPQATLPVAAQALAEAAEEYWSPVPEWELLVREVVFAGRAGDARLTEFLEAFPDPESASKLRSARSEHERRARIIGRRLLRAGAVPETVAEVQALAGCTESVARLLVSLVYGGAPPRTGGTSRVAERVSGVQRRGSLNGVTQVALARLAGFGVNPSVNQLLVDISRSVCLADDPLCGECPLAPRCYYKMMPGAQLDESAMGDDGVIVESAMDDDGVVLGGL